ncbi:MAG: hypothetical protein BKP49_07640 [Treponema sp. CETP13]|nr:MAG: hypothetical protein BKP49_07640 [Treponema sp. CETP13]
MNKKNLLCVAISLLAILSVGLTSCTSKNEEKGPETAEAHGQMAPPKQQGGDMVQPDFTAAAVALGVSEDELIEAMGDPRGGRPDFAAIAEKLGVTEEDLIAALGVPATPNDEMPAE